MSALIDLAHAENESQSLRQAIPLVWGMELSMVAVSEFANSFAARMHLWKEYASGDNTELPIALPTTVQEQLTKLAGLRSNVPVRVLNKATVFLVHRFDSVGHGGSERRVHAIDVVECYDLQVLVQLGTSFQ